ncbi:MAG: NADH-quinone oxidoreductase subunit L [Proteobacteria bacterium]|nr:NADH-quinone oxidoreductase subunit L [Pseudomonadota bacterium]
MNTALSVATFLLLGAPLVAGLSGLLGLKEKPLAMRKLSLVGAGISFVSALILGYGVLETGAIDRIFGIVGNPDTFHFSVGVWIDRLSILSVLLITSIGLVVQRYSVRYLDGDKRQGRFFAWLSFVLFSVTLFVISRNLLALTLSWFLVSFGVHRLLLHFSEREAAQKAAWRKFVISRIGDVALLFALILTYSVFGTFELSEIFEIVRNHGSWEPLNVLGVTLNPAALVGSLYVIGAMTKSAQFPFHIWLPDTMETPTPVSALMHAGIINAGGFLIVRLSPIVSHASLALHILFAVGALTALFGGLIYLVQTDIKRSLAYSTISQMGYMMMQCGLGAFSAAVLHLIMHGFYKANAFLSAASRIDTTPTTFDFAEKSEKGSSFHRSISAAIALGLVILSITTLGIDLSAKPGGLFLCIFLWFSATQAITPVMRNPSGSTPLLIVVGLSYGGMLLYWTALGALASFLDPVLMLGAQNPVFGELNHVFVALVAVLFVGMFVFVEVARDCQDKKWAKQVYVLCLNHFYIEQLWRKVIFQMLGKTEMMPSFETLAITKVALQEKNDVHTKY